MHLLWTCWSRREETLDRLFLLFLAQAAMLPVFHASDVASLLRALIAKPDVLLLDEMTSGLDPVNAREMIELLGKELPHAVIVLVTHQAFLYPLADQIIQLKGEECYGESIHPIATN